MEGVRKISKKYYLRQIVACFLVSCLFFNAPAALAEVVLIGTPPGITVDPVVVNPTGPDTQAMSADNGAIGTFSNFDIADGLIVNCSQGGSSTANALFKVFSDDGTQIYGIFNAEGNIYLQDILGLLVGPTGEIHANQFVATTVNIDNQDWQDFISGVTAQLKFQRGGEDSAAVLENQGLINALTSVYLVGSKVLNSGTINAPQLLVMAAGDKVFLTHDGTNVRIQVPTDLLTPDPASNVVDNDGTINASAAQIVLAAGDIFSAALDVGSLAATANGDITLEGTVQTAGDMTLTADFDGDGAGTMWAQSTLTSTAGSIEVSASDTTVDFDADVTAAIDLLLNNNTEAAAGIALTAGGNVDIAAGKILTAEGDLAIEATGGEIMADTAIIDMAADGMTLALTQYAGMDLEQDFSVDNRSNTNLVADSTGGSVSSIAAGEWSSIAAHAAENITLSDISEVITTGALTTDNGDIIIDSQQGTVEAYGAISAGRDVKITATADETSDSILLYNSDWNPQTAEIEAGRDIWLNNNTYASAPTTLRAGQDIRLGYNENLDTYEAKTLTVEEHLLMEADRDITLGGDVTVIGSEPETLIVKADADTVNEEPGAVLGGDVHAMAALTTIGGYDNDILVYGDNVQIDGVVTSAADVDIEAIAGNVTLADAVTADGSIELTATGDVAAQGNLDAGINIDIYSSDDTTYLGGDLIQAAGDVTLHNNTVANGGDQRIDAVNGTLTAEKNVDKSTAGDMTLGGGLGITLGGDVTGSGLTASDSITLEDAVTASAAADQRIDAGAGALHAIGTITKGATATGSLTLGGDEGIDLDGTVDVDAGSLFIEDDFIAAGHLLASDHVTLDGSGELDGPDQRIDAQGGILTAKDDIIKTTSGMLTLAAGDTIYLAGDVSTNTTDGAFSMNHLIFEDPVIANGTGDNKDQTFTAAPLAAQAGSSLHAYSTITKIDGGDPYIDGDGGSLTLQGGWQVNLDGAVVVEDGSLTIEADQDIDLGGNVRSWADMVIKADADGDALDLFNDYYPDFADIIGGDVFAHGTLESTHGSITISGFDEPTNLDHAAINLYVDALAADDVTLHNNTKLLGEGWQEIAAGLLGNGTLTAEGWVWKITPGDLYLYGNNPGTDAISLNYAGCLPAASTCLGNLELYAPSGDIQISGDLTTFGFCEFGNDYVQADNGNGSCLEGWYDRPTGGVSVIADNGKIYTEGASPENDTLNIGIVANSDQYEGLGVDLPYDDIYDNGYYNGYYDGYYNGYDNGYYEPKKAAIVVMSSEDLKLGPDTMLIARGAYDSTLFDDRPGVGFLADSGTYIGDVLRDEGDPIDVAVYVASTEGDVLLDGRAIDVAPGGTMVVDAYDTVTFGDFDTFNLGNFEGCKDLGCFLIKLALRFHEDIDFYQVLMDWEQYRDQYDRDDATTDLDILQNFLDDYFDDGQFFNIDRLEVASRITEWLFQALLNGTLPYPDDPAVVEAFIGGDYVMRGAGLANPLITDGRAWVLDNPQEPAPLYTEAGQRPEEEEFAQGGCPALLEWLAAEIGVPAEDMQAFVADAFAYSTDIQPCQACAQLKDAAAILADDDGTRVAALARVVNEFVAPGAPIAAEQMALVAAAVTSPTAGTHYAAAGEWLDALVQYVSILNTEMGYSAAETLAFVGKYTTPITQGDNATLAAYVEARLAALSSL